MSKLISGDAKIDDVSLVMQAAVTLGWQVAYNVPVMFYDGPGPVCDVTVRPQGELDMYQGDVGRKYTIGFQQNTQTGKVSMLHDNAMDGGAMYSVESGLQDATTRRVVGKLKQAIAVVELKRIYHKQKASWRTTVREDGAHVHVFNRG